MAPYPRSRRECIVVPCCSFLDCARSSLDRHTLSSPLFATAVFTYCRSLHITHLIPPHSFRFTYFLLFTLVYSSKRVHSKYKGSFHYTTNDPEKRYAFLTLISTTASALATSILPRPQANESFRRPSILQAFDLPAFKTPPTTFPEDKLPAIGHDISRPSSSSTVASYTQQRHGSNASIQLPALSTLASVASNSPAANNHSNDSNDNTRKETPEKKMPSPPRYVANACTEEWMARRHAVALPAAVPCRTSQNGRFGLIAGLAWCRTSTFRPPN